MSALPKIDHPLFNIEVPSLKKQFKFRPFLVREEKILLMAKESENLSDILIAIKQIVNNCKIDRKLDINKLALFDLEYIFLKLRSVSVDNTIKVSYNDNQDNKNYDFVIDINDVKIKYPEKTDNNITITDTSGILMKYPSATLYEDKEFLNLEKDQLFELIVRCVDKIYSGEEIYNSIEYKKEDIVEFLENLSVKTFEKIQTFLMNTPKLEYKINYKNELGNDREIILSSLSDFFTWQ